jgi:hypothetical protein
VSDDSDIRSDPVAQGDGIPDVANDRVDALKGAAIDPPKSDNQDQGDQHHDDVRNDVLVATIADLLDADRGDAFLAQLVASPGGRGIAESGLAPMLRQLRLDLGNQAGEARAFERFTEALDHSLIDRDGLMRMAPLLAALMVRIVLRGLKNGGVQADSEDRRHLVRQGIAATRELIERQGAGGLKPLPLVARRLARHALRRGKPPAALADALPRIVARLSTEPGLMQRLARAGAPRSAQTGRGMWGHPRDFVLDSPVEITILAR